MSLVISHCLSPSRFFDLNLLSGTGGKGGNGVEVGGKGGTGKAPHCSQISNMLIGPEITHPECTVSALPEEFSCQAL